MNQNQNIDQKPNAYLGNIGEELVQTKIPLFNPNLVGGLIFFPLLVFS